MPERIAECGTGAEFMVFSMKVAAEAAEQAAVKAAEAAEEAFVKATKAAAEQAAKKGAGQGEKAAAEQAAKDGAGQGEKAGAGQGAKAAAEQAEKAAAEKAANDQKLVAMRVEAAIKQANLERSNKIHHALLVAGLLITHDIIAGVALYKIMNARYADGRSVLLRSSSYVLSEEKRIE